MEGEEGGVGRQGVSLTGDQPEIRGDGQKLGFQS